MSVVECAVPEHGALDRQLVQHANFRDAWRAPLARGDRDVVDIFFAVFAHRPLWMSLLLVARNGAAALAGLETPTIAEVMAPERRERYAVGEKIGPWPIFFLDQDELVAGRDNPHMDFRLSLLKEPGPSVVVSTVCTVNNSFGRRYLAAVIPFHKFGLRRLLTSAVAAGRL